jgi:hypothetical protein
MGRLLARVAGIIRPKFLSAARFFGLGADGLGAGYTG